MQVVRCNGSNCINKIQEILEPNLEILLWVNHTYYRHESKIAIGEKDYSLMDQIVKFQFEVVV